MHEGYLIIRFSARPGKPGETARVCYPIAALHNAGLWELDAGAAEAPNAHGNSIPQRWFNEHQPRNGLIAPVYALVRDSPEEGSPRRG